MGTHSAQAELVISRMALMELGLIDQVDDVVGAMARHICYRAHFRILPCRFRQFLDRPLQGLTHLLHPQHLVGDSACAARILNVFLAARYFHQVVGDAALGRPKVDLECQGVTCIAGQHARERRVGDDAAIPVMLALNFDGGEFRRQRAGGRKVLRSQPAVGGIEIGQIAGADIDRADADAHFARVQPVEVNKPLQRLMQWCRVVEAGCGIARERRPQRRGEARFEESGLTWNKALAAAIALRTELMSNA